MTVEAPLSITVRADELAPPGISGDVWQFQVRPETPESEIRLLAADTSERDFDVTCVFFRESAFSRQIEAQIAFGSGTSFFTLPEGVDDPGWFISGGIRYEVVLNTQREFAGVRSRVRARSVQAARDTFSQGLAPILDHMSYTANVPLIASSPSCHDIKNLGWVFGYTSPYATHVVGAGTANLHVELAPVYALYREAKNASSLFYRFLCYYKILEGIFRRLRPELFKKAAARRITLTRSKEVIPEHRELRLFAPDLIGRPIKEYFDRVLQKEFRDAVAHYVLDDTGSILSPSAPDAVNKFTDITLPTELCCRTVVAQHERHLDELEALPPAHGC